MDVRELIKRKAYYPVRLIAFEDMESTKEGEEVGIEAIDFSCGQIRCVNKNQSLIFYLYYDKETWKLEGDWRFKF